MNEEDLSLFLDSFERCLKNDRFIPIFYDIFLNSSEEIPGLFKNTDFSRQRRMLRVSLFEMAVASARRSIDLSSLSALTQRHHELKIQPRHYELWMQSLIAAVSECDKYFNPEVARVWQEAFRSGIDYMKADHGLD